MALLCIGLIGVVLEETDLSHFVIPREHPRLWNAFQDLK